jgi:hypothetical protein
LTDHQHGKALALILFSCQADHQNDAQQIESVPRADVFAPQRVVPVSLHFVQLNFVGYIHQL